MKKLGTLTITAILLISITVFTLQNSQIVVIKLLFWEAEASLSMILFTVFSTAILITVIAIIPTIYHLKKLRDQSQKKVKSLVKESEKLSEPEAKNIMAEGQVEK
ncbi:lipopolysaccharide assembly protein LapA domain-containing protein [Aquimarina algiphila]|uniref:LapA family protein n=1 Tax=Aquimarina algiphila TaxID=2047982 RepID=A0A554VLR6_9FLAO|nr:LapA family protein [Aquimarina algiphila]TSE09124.1 LapA family protein [Aquimarina algiphila]